MVMIGCAVGDEMPYYRVNGILFKIKEWDGEYRPICLTCWWQGRWEHSLTHAETEARWHARFAH